MKDLRTLSAYAVSLPGAPSNTARAGAFRVPVPATGSKLLVVASALLGWDHVSVSHPSRCPNWIEMSRIKELFFLPEECAMQLHVPEAEHINNHPYCLHLWRPHDVEIPRPPAEFVGVKGMSVDQARSLGDQKRQQIQAAAAERLERKKFDPWFKPCPSHGARFSQFHAAPTGEITRVDFMCGCAVSGDAVRDVMTDQGNAMIDRAREVISGSRKVEPA